MERNEYISRIRKLLHDPEGKVWDDEELNSMLDNAVKAFCLDTAAFRGDFKFCADENGLCELPENYVGFLAGWNGEGTHIESASTDYLSRRYGNYGAVNGQAQFISEDLNTIGQARLVPNPHSLQNVKKLYGSTPYGIPYCFTHEEIPLTFTAVEASTVRITATGSPTFFGLHYRTGTSGTWLPYAIGDTINLAAGKKVQFWNLANALSGNDANYCRFAITGKVNATGDLMSLLNWSATCQNYCFINLFRDNDALLSAPEISAATLASNCLRSMFAGCTSLTSAARIYAAAAYTNCCYQMYDGCSSLSTVPDPFPFDTMAAACCYAMFRNCISLKKFPQISATFANHCCNSMFYGDTALEKIHIATPELQAYSCYQMAVNCSSLAEIEVDFTNWNAANSSTAGWLSGIAASGTYIKPAALPEEYGPNRIPTGWTVINK